MSDRLFTPRFFVMCGFTFTVFLSVFQLLPTAPFHIIDLGGSTFASGLFLGFLTYSSAFSAPLTGAFADRVGPRRVLLTSSIAITFFSIVYAVLADPRWMLAIVIVHGIFWSGLLSASAAYMTNLLPERRRAEGIGYWGLSTVAALAVAPTIGFWIYRRGWVWLCAVSAALNIMMAIIAWFLKEQPVAAAHERTGGLLEWRVLALSVTLFLYSFGYGGITSFTAMYAEANHVTPKAIYLTTLAIVILLIRPMAGRLGDRWGYKRVFVPCLGLITAGPDVPGVRRIARVDDRVGHPVRDRIRDRVPGLRRIRDARRQRGAPRRGVRRDPRRLRHRRRHRFDEHGLADPAPRIPDRFRRGRGALGARPAVFPDHGPDAEQGPRLADCGLNH